LRSGETLRALRPGFTGARLRIDAIAVGDRGLYGEELDEHVRVLLEAVMS
jgi:hypothetical protein